jgi:hypothetical protein
VFDRDLYSTEELAIVMRMGANYVKTEARDGRLVGMDFRGATGYRFHIDDVRRWLESKKARPGSS